MVRVIGSGDLLRAHVTQKTEFGVRVQAALDSGAFVQDGLMLELIWKEMAEQLVGDRNASFVLDGFPRTQPQADALDEKLQGLNTPLNMVVNLDVPQEEILNRISQRWVHEASGRVYNMSYNPPKVDRKDDLTGEPLMRRKDDTVETYQLRLEKYRQVTFPLLKHYEMQGILYTVTGDTSDIIWSKLEAEMAARYDLDDQVERRVGSSLG